MNTICLDLTPQQQKNADVCDNIMKATILWYTTWYKTATKEKQIKHAPRINELTDILVFYRDNFIDE